MPSLTRVEATARGAAITVESYQVDLDLTGDGDLFRSRVEIRFRATAGAATFVEVKPAELLGVRLNDRDLDPGLLDRQPAAARPAWPRTNTLVVEAEMAYSNTGEGMHRFVDPADGETYLYAACPSSTTRSASSPPSTSPTSRPRSRCRSPRRRSGPSPATAELAADPAARALGVRPDRAAGHLLRLADRRAVPRPARRARRHPAGHLLPPVARRAPGRRRRGDLHRSPGSASTGSTSSSPSATRSASTTRRSCPSSTPARWRTRAWSPSATTSSSARRSPTPSASSGPRTIAHEMAHMWFGDLVTMRWWDDLWLNESFAEYLGTRVTAEATRFDQAWTTFAMRRKAWGYAADQRPSTHPVAPAGGRRHRRGPAQLRRHLVRQGRQPCCASSSPGSATRRSSPASTRTSPRTASATPPSPTCSPASPPASGRDLSAWAELWLRRAAGQHAACRGRRRRRRPLHRGGGGADRARRRTRCCARTGSASGRYADGRHRCGATRWTSTRTPTAAAPCSPALTGEPAARSAAAQRR